MKSIATFVLLLISGASCRDVMMERAFVANTSIEHWLRASTPSDECTKRDVVGVVGVVGVVAVGDITRHHEYRGNQVRDPDDCKRFFMCLGEGRVSTNSFACSDYGLNYLCFDPEAGQCSDDSFVCNSVCGTNPQKCRTTCKAHNTAVADVTDCSRFFVCLADPNLPGEFFKDVHACGSEYPYFNGAHCVKDESACCKCQKDVCLKEGDLIADPQDCHSYYTCVVFGVNLIPVGPVPCEGTGSFINGACNGPTDCAARCDLGGGGDTTATTTTTTTTTATIPTITPPPTNPECKDIHDFICPGKGNYARCTSCDPFFFICEGLGHKPTQKSCSSRWVIKVFHPEYHYCVEPSVCPQPTLIIG